MQREGSPFQGLGVVILKGVGADALDYAGHLEMEPAKTRHR